MICTFVDNVICKKLAMNASSFNNAAMIFDKLKINCLSARTSIK